MIVAALFLSVYGSVPQQFQLFVMTPFPVIMHPVYATVSRFNGITQQDFFVVFCSSVLCMAFFICFALIAIYLGPLYGIIRENSTFGEVVREGDAKSKRWFRFRMHIQRSSEIAFFYENRSHSFLRSEGLLRWGAALCGLLLLSSASFAGIAYFASKELPLLTPPSIHWAVFVFHRADLMIHGFGLALAAILFSHPKNTTYQRLPFFRGRTCEVSRLDTIAFLLFTAFSTTASIKLHRFLSRKVRRRSERNDDFSCQLRVSVSLRELPITFIHIAIEGTIVITVAGLVVYTFQRLACLSTWSRSVTCVSVGAVYSVFFCTLPMFFAMLCLEVPDLRSIRLFADWAPTVAASSPIAVMFILFNGQIGPTFPKNVSTAPFFISHVTLFCLMLLGIRRGSRKLRRMYLTEPTGKAADG